jgi:hypothetical protein
MNGIVLFSRGADSAAPVLEIVKDIMCDLYDHGYTEDEARTLSLKICDVVAAVSTEWARFSIEEVWRE